MKFNEVSNRAQKEAKFFRELQGVARKAAKKGMGSEEWKALAKYFADDDRELSLLAPTARRLGSGRGRNLNLTMNLLEVLVWRSGGIHGTTTDTTTTTSELCSLPGICPPKSKKASGKSTRRSTKKGGKAKKG